MHLRRFRILAVFLLLSSCGPQIGDAPPGGNGEGGNGNGEVGNGNGEAGNGNGEAGNGNGEAGNGNGEAGNGNGEPTDPTGPVTVTYRVTGPSDALTSYLIGFSSWNIFSGASVPIGRHWDDGHPSYHTAFRFEGVDIPAGATIESATLSFHPTNEVDSNNRLLINVYAELAEDSEPYDPSNYDTGRPDQRLKTSAFIEQWVIRCNASCTDDTEYDCPQRQLDCWHRDVRYDVPRNLGPLVQEVVDQSGWQAGNAISMFLFNAAGQGDSASWTGSRSITGYDDEKGEAYVPELTVTYEVQ